MISHACRPSSEHIAGDIVNFFPQALPISAGGGGDKAEFYDIADLPLNTVLETFGDFFLKHCLRHGYDNMLRTLGRDMKSFIQNLDSLHALLTLTYDKLVAPSFRSCGEYS